MLRDITAVVNNHGKLADAQVTSITLTEDQLNTVAGGAGNDLDDAFAADSITVGAVSNANAKTTLLANGDKVANDGITSITLTDGEFDTFIGAATAAPLAAGSVTLGVVTGNQATIVTNIAKVAAGGISTITLTEGQIDTLAGGAGNDLGAAFAADSITVGAVTDGSNAETTLLANGDNIATGGITSITLTDGEFDTFIGAATAAPLAAGSVTLGVVTGNEATVVTNLAKVATNGGDLHHLGIG